MDDSKSSRNDGEDEPSQGPGFVISIYCLLYSMHDFSFFSFLISFY